MTDIPKVSTPGDVEHEAILQEAFGTAPDFLDIPEEMQQQIEDQVEAKERFFWLNSRRIQQDIVTRALLRRALYAETRLMEAECRLGEMAIITKAAAERVEQLQKQLTTLAEGGKVDVPEDLLDFELEGKD